MTGRGAGAICRIGFLYSARWNSGPIWRDVLLVVDFIGDDMHMIVSFALRFGKLLGLFLLVKNNAFRSPPRGAHADVPLRYGAVQAISGYAKPSAPACPAAFALALLLAAAALQHA
jgi:hypothetical protein